MTPARKPALVIVETAPTQALHRGREATAVEQSLLNEVPCLNELKAEIAEIERRVAALTRMLASERGVSFIRLEAVNAEFGR